jgi:hypothetical protein
MSSSQWPQKRQTAAQRANEANRAQQVAVNDKGGRPSDRRAPAAGEALDQGLTNDNRPVGVGLRK